MEQLDDHGKSDGTNGQVDEEGPAPRGLVSEDTAQQRSDDGGEAKNGTDHALVLATVAQRDNVGDDDHDQAHDASGTDASNATGHNQHDHALGGATQGRADQKDGDCEQEGGLTAKDVREFTWEIKKRGVGGGWVSFEIAAGLLGSDNWSPTEKYREGEVI